MSESPSTYEVGGFFFKRSLDPDYYDCYDVFLCNMKVASLDALTSELRFKDDVSFTVTGLSDLINATQHLSQFF
jgi:hypothetical protein